ncbi:myoD family inhibitor isoform X2 [Salmo salar]|uniref:MyoD family inhibitor isoform X2 n=1 Tax=Salmo salar TaxID=8030 RepID=A0ABM3CM82_SALSA|nr:myoD family inhibitor isoform X2 [Salmo salar]XP_045547651.1 myoD family inhibitor isoform X2 [Salmo salar]XP_045547652.1 myoD family inhibitor isoform X2 [Salmo salar]
MDEERSPPVSSPEPPDDRDPLPPTPHPNPSTDIPASTPISTPTHTTDLDRSMEPLIEMPKVKPEGLLGDTENGNNNNSLSQPDLTTPSKSITCQPQARSTHIHPTQPCLTQSTSQPRDGAKPHTQPSLTQSTSQPRDGAKPHTHGPNCTHAPHTNGVRNGGPCDRPAPGSLPKAASSSSSSGMKNSKKLQSNPSITSQSSKRSKSSSKSNSSQIPTEVQDDCCVHCILACLFCEFLTLCNIVLDCATCGSCAGDDSACFCCCCASEECGDCELPCDMDCGIIDACCESADCLEICMECCGLCFSS